jgi:LmbE family N-acetylglucosaminyl deacetylase
MKTVLCVAPHPDDETLGCGGTLLKHKAAGDKIHWVIATTIEGGSYSESLQKKRRAEIAKVTKLYGFKSVTELGFQTTKLDEVPEGEFVARMGAAFKAVSPEIVYLPFAGDAHGDHKAVFAAAAACTKWFRYPSLRRVLAYETLSETDFALDPQDEAFRPNVFVDISKQLAKKLAILKTYSGELGKFPFPRSEKAVRAAAQVRGSAAGFTAAEAFMLLRERL